MRRKAQLELEAEIAAFGNAFNRGNDYFRQRNDLMLVEVARHAATLFAEEQQQIAFLQGYSRARSQHDEFLRESEL